MARVNYKKGGSGSFKNKKNSKPGRHNNSNNRGKNFDFGDAVFDASKFLNGGSSNSVDDDDNENFQFEDEELDSDDALGSDDDLDDYMVKKSKNDNDDLNEYGEEDDGWESVDEGELMTLSEIWDRDDKELADINDKSSKKSKDKEIIFNDNDESSESEEEEDDDDDDDSSAEEESDSSNDSEEEDDDPFDEMNISDDDDNQVELNAVMKNLKTKLPKDKSRKQLINDNSAENEFSLPNQGDALTFDDMLEDIDDLENDNEEGEESTDLIRDIAKSSKQQKELQNLELEDDEREELQQSNSADAPFAIPLPINIQKRHDRRAAYEIQKDQVNRWKDIIAHNRDAKVLKFIPEKVQVDSNSAFKTDNDIAINDFESKLDSIIDESNLESKKTEDLFENIETAKMSKAEMLKRTNELRLMRELMYRGMKDSKRLKKIKSKAYRKQMRKEKMKEKMLISQANRQEGIESDDGQEEDAEYQRAKERMTLKHKNTSSWAKQMIKSGLSKDKSTRDEMEEMLRQGETLKLKQLGKGGNGDSDDELDERNLSDLEKDVENMEEVDDDKLSKIGKGVLAMDFMKNAAERERLIKLKEIQDMKNFQNGSHQEEYDNDVDEGVNLNINSGRRLYTPSALAAAEEARKIDEEMKEELDEEDSRLLSNRLAVKERDNFKTVETRKRKHPLDKRNTRDAQDDVSDDEANPWLMENDDANDSDEENQRFSSKIKIIDETSSKLDKSGAKIAKKLSKRKAALKKEKGEDEDSFTLTKIENKETLQIIDPKKQKPSKINSTNAAAKSDDEYESEGDNEDDIRMFKQSDLIKEAFAGDDVLVEEFEKEKHEVEEEEGDKQVDLTVPGWGSWAGTEEGTDDGWGVPRNNKKRKIIKTIQGVVSKDKRLDKNKANVIINEKVNKKNTKYQADKVPYPYKTWEEYERSLRVPLGKEWTTSQTHSKMITPNVITKFGSVIDPLKAPFSEN